MAWPETFVFLCCSRRDLLIHCSGPEEEVEVVGYSSNKAAWIASAVGSQPPALITALSLGATQHDNEVTVVYQNGLPVISVSLPSRRERCQFTLKPLSDCVGVFLQQLQAEDRGIDRVAIYSTDGARVASSTGIDILLLDDFKLVINDTTHLVRPPRRELLPHEEAERLNDVKFLVQQLYTTLRIEEHQLSKERELIGRLEDLNSQLRPLEKVREELSKKAERRTTWVLWGGMAYMATQFGILARLTWWEYSWDIMEPVTYFITYGTAMAMYAYFVLTRQGVKRTRFDIEKYNKLKDDIAEVELDLKRLRDPLQLQLPVQQLNAGYTGTPTLAILRVDTVVYSSPASPCSQTVNTHTWLGQALGRVSIPHIKVYKEVLTPPAAMCHGWGSLQSHHQGDLRLPAAEHCCLSLPGPLLLLVTDSCPSPCDLCQEPVSTRRMQGRRQSARLVSSSC
eukprot:superscaffoldBa00000195_g2600